MRNTLVSVLQQCEAGTGHNKDLATLEDRFHAVSILAYDARGRGFDLRTVLTFVCMNMSVGNRSGCFCV
jgi:hypothetical protein